MTSQTAVAGIPRLAPLWEGSRIAPGQADEPLAPRCTRCGAVGTHYLTCPSLRLPPGYRLSEDPVGPGFRPGPARRRGGPDHPDWPRPPRH
jgi:hypothetical protein